jgi:hypothetical protein
MTSLKETQMSRKISLALAAGAVVIALSGTAAAQGVFPSSANEYGPEAGEAPTTMCEQAGVPVAAGAAEASYPAAANECGPALGEAPTTVIGERRAIGATGSGAGGLLFGPREAQADHDQGWLLDD